MPLFKPFLWALLLHILCYYILYILNFFCIRNKFVKKSNRLSDGDMWLLQYTVCLHCILFCFRDVKEVCILCMTPWDGATVHVLSGHLPGHLWSRGVFMGSMLGKFLQSKACRHQSLFLHSSLWRHLEPQLTGHSMCVCLEYVCDWSYMWSVQLLNIKGR